jgi:hypothetical protein
LFKVAFCHPDKMAPASAPAGKTALINATMAVPLSQPAICKSTGTPPKGTLRVVRSGLQGNWALSALPSKATSRQFWAGLQALKVRAPTRLATKAVEWIRMG